MHLVPQLSSKRSRHNEKPTHSKRDPAQPQINKFIIVKKKKSSSQGFTYIKPSLHPPSWSCSWASLHFSCHLLMLILCHFLISYHFLSQQAQSFNTRAFSPYQTELPSGQSIWLSHLCIPTGLFKVHTGGYGFQNHAWIIARTRKQPKCPSAEEWIKKKRYIYTMECNSAIKRNEIVPFAAWIELSEVIQKEKNQYHVSLYVESRKIVQVNLSANQK